MTEVNAVGESCWQKGNKNL